MFCWKKMSFEQVLEEYDLMQKELDSCSKSLISDTIISINCDTISLEECEQLIVLLKSSLSTVAIILRAQAAHELVNDVTNIDQARKYKDGPIFYTRYVTKIVFQSICDYLFNSERMKLLAFRNLLFSSDFHSVCSGITNNKSLKILFFKNCDISDERCSKICQAIRKSPVEILGLENCNLSSFGVSWISWLLKEQSMIRTLAKWSSNKFQNEYLYKGDQGLKKICLNDNPRIDDSGAKLLIDSLQDNKWVIQVHMENTGITNTTCELIVNLAESTNVEVFDVMRNNITSTSTLALAIEKLSKNKSKINRTLFKSNGSKVKQKTANKILMKLPIKHSSEMSLSHSDSSCVNSTDNHNNRFSHVVINPKMKVKKPMNVKCAPSPTSKYQNRTPFGLDTNNLVEFFKKTEKKVNSKIRLDLNKKKETSINNIRLLQKPQLPVL